MENDKYVWIGCHEVTNNDPVQAHGPFGIPIEMVGNRIYFKQITTDGTMAPVVTATPCED